MMATFIIKELLLFFVTFKGNVHMLQGYCYGHKPPYIFGNLEITGKFECRPGTGRFLTFPVAWSHIVRASAVDCT